MRIRVMVYACCFGALLVCLPAWAADSDGSGNGAGQDDGNSKQTASQDAANAWRIPELSHRWTVRVKAVQADHLPRAYVVPLDLTQLTRQHALDSIDTDAFVVLPARLGPKEEATPLASQFNQVGTAGPQKGSDVTGELTFYWHEPIKKGDAVDFHVYFDRKGKRSDLAKPDALVSVGEKAVMWPKGDPKPHASFHLKNLDGEYYWHIKGCSFASIIDRNENDWVTWKSKGFWGGKYRGLPNSWGPYHPGYTKADSKVLFSGPVRVRIDANKGEFIWDVFPRRIRATRTRGKHDKWWYEGTPGGSVDAEDTYLLSDGREEKITTTYQGILKEHWLVYKDAHTKAALFLESHPGSVKTKVAGAKKTGPDTMLVTRFNLPKEPNPMYFTLGLIYKNDNKALQRAVHSACRQPTITLEGSETKPEGS